MGLLGMLSGAGSSAGGGINVGTAIAYLELNTQAFDAGISTAVSKLDGAKNGLSGSLKNVGSAMTSVGSALTKSVTLPVVGLGTAAVKTFANFEQGMADVKAIAGQVTNSQDFKRIVNIGQEMGLSYKEGADMTETAMNIVKAKAEEVGATTEWTSTQAAEAFKYMALAGWDVGDMLEGIDPIINLATASGEDLATVSDIVTDSLTAYGLEAKDAGHFTDILAQTQRSSNTTVALMGQSMKFAAPLVGALGMSAEDASIALGLMANSGIKSSMAGTSLRSVLSRLAKPTKETQIAMDELGISLEDDNGQMVSLRSIFDKIRAEFRGGQGDVNAYTKQMALLDNQYAAGQITQEEYEQGCEDLITALYGVSGAEKVKLAAMLAGKTGMSGLMAIVNASEEDYNNLTKAIDNCSGATNEMAEIMRDTTENKLKLMTSAIDAALRSFGELLAPTVIKVANAIKDFADKINNLDDNTKQMVITIAGIAAAAGPVLVIFGTLASSIGNIISLFSKLKGAIGLISGALGGLSAPVLGIIAALAAVAAAVIYLWNTNEEFRNNIIAAWDKIKAKVGAAIEDIKAAFEAMKPLLNWILETWGKMFADQIENIMEVLSGLVEFIAGILQIIGGLVKGFKDGDWTMLWDGIKNILKGALDIIVGLVKAWANVFLAPFRWIYDELLGHSIIPDICNGMIEWFSNAFMTVIEFVQNFVNKIIEWFQELFEMVRQWFIEFIEAIKEWWGNLIDAIKEKWQGFKDWLAELWTSIKEFFIETWTSMKEAFIEIWNGVKEFFTNIWNAMKDFFIEVWNAIKEFFIELWDELVQKVSDCIDKIIEFVKNMWDKAKQWFNTVKQTISGFLEDIKNKIKDAFEWIRNKAKEFIDNAKSKLRDFFDHVKEKVRELKEKVIETVRDMFENIRNKISESFEWIRNKLHEFLENAKQKIRDFIQHVLDKVRDFKEKVIQTLQELFDNAKQKFEEMISLIREKISEIVQTVREKITEIVETVREKIQEIVDTVKEWLEKVVETTKEKLKEIWQAIHDGLSEILEKIKEKCEEIWENIKEFATKLKEGAQQLFENLVEKVKSFASRFKEAGRHLFNNLWDGIKEIWGQITAWIEDKVSWVAQKISSMINDVRNAASSIGDFFDGSHATGLSYVPYNGYIAQLHEGERVLTKQENREYSAGRTNGGGNTYNIYSYEKLDEYNIRRELEKMRRQLDL